MIRSSLQSLHDADDSRRALAPAFTDRALKTMESRITHCIDAYCKLLKSKQESATGWTCPINFSDLGNHLAFDILGSLAFGDDSLDMVMSSHNHYVIELISATSHWALMVCLLSYDASVNLLNAQCGTFPLLRTLRLDFALFSKQAGQRKQFIDFCKDKATLRTSSNADFQHKDFFHYMTSSKSGNTGEQLPLVEVWAECRTLIVAGSDTIATALAATLHYLAHDASIMKKLTDEICSMFDTEEELRFPEPGADRCPYLRACIDEAMRLSPPIAGCLPREVLKGGIMIDGNYICEGTVVGTGIYAIHHNPRYFPRPFEYIPERWIPGSSPDVTCESIAVARSAFVPFSLGPRGCIGKSLAYGELSTIVARTIWRYHIRLHQGSEPGALHGTADRRSSEPYELKDKWQAQRYGPVLEFQPRRGGGDSY